MPAKKKPLTALARKRAANKRAATTLALKHDKFITTYLLNGENGTQAYLAAWPKVQANSAASEAYKLLRIPEIMQRMRELRVIGHKNLVKGFEETVQEVGNLAFFDPINMFDEEGRLLKLHEMDPITRKMTHEIELLLSDDQAVLQLAKVKYGKDKGKYLDMMMKFHNAFGEHQHAGSGTIVVQMYCAQDANL